MELTKCIKGHFYDANKNTSCPYCGREVITKAVPLRFQELGELTYIGQGSTSQVFKISGTKTYALKVILCGNNESKYQHAIYELEIMKHLAGLNRTVQLCDHEIVNVNGDSVVYLLEEYHVSLSDYLTNGTISISDVIRIVIGICNALVDCKKAGIMHLDIQPKNIYVDNPENIKIGDFSSSLFVNDITYNHSMRGTLAYIAPEVYRQQKCGELSDIYSVGLILYSLLNKKVLPFMDTDSEDVSIYKRLAGTPFSHIVLSNETVNKELNRIIRSACSYCSENRFQSFEQFSDELLALLQLINKTSVGSEVIYNPLDSAYQRIIPLVYVLQTTESMNGLPIAELNGFVENTLQEITKHVEHSEMDIRVSILTFGGNAEWIIINKKISDCHHLTFETSGVSSLGLALKELDMKLKYLDNGGILPANCYRPTIIFVAHRQICDDYQQCLKKLNCNKWYSRAIKIGFSLGDDYGTKLLTEVIGNSEAILKPNDIENFYRLFKAYFVSYSSVADRPFDADSISTSHAYFDADSVATTAPLSIGDWDDIAWDTEKKSEDDYIGGIVVPDRKLAGRYSHKYRRSMHKYNYRNICKYNIEPQDVKIKKVEFSAVAPKLLVKGEYSIINIIMYEEQFRSIVDDIITEMDNPVQETKSGVQKIKTRSEIRVVLNSPDIMIEDNTEIRKWQGEYLNFTFDIFLPDQYRKRQVLLTATVYVNDIIATRLKFTVKCTSLLTQKIEITREDFLSAFVSYASEDRNRVVAIIQGMQKARPDMDIFFDVERLRSGEDWENALRYEIEKRDVLYLCWSHFAQESKWVDFEWRYAFENKGADCIEPVPIEPPTACPPPSELSKKHFNDKLLYFISPTDDEV